MVTLFAILVPITTVSAWSHRTVLDTGTYIDTIKPIANDPAVIEAASREITDQIFTALDVPTAVTNALPANAALLAGPIATGARDYVQQAVNTVLSSAAFQTLWVEANRFAHGELVAALRGDRTALQLTGDAVVLNLVPLLNAALERSKAFVSRVTGHDVSLPVITGDEAPAAACAKISAALDRPLPQTCGVITLFRAHNLAVARRGVQAFDRILLALLIITPLLAVAAVALSRRRRRTLLQLSVSAAIGLIIARRAVIWGKGQLVAGGRPENHDARAAIVRHLMSGFFDLTLWLVGAALLVTAVALVTGPYAWAVSTRRAARVATQAIRAGATGDPKVSAASDAVVWAREHYNVLRYGGIAVAVLLVAALNLNWITFIVIAGLLAMFEIGVARLHSMPPSGTPPAGVGGATT